MTDCAPSPYVAVMRVASQTPRIENGALPRNIQPDSRAWTVPSRRCRDRTRGFEDRPVREVGADRDRSG